ncbi:hypothetical protein O181_045116 [Austropuccinia psidii MF-1]|uniref:E3 ubiquitin-protein ligase listerin n=1 Tax=Austropuccinia psidii MF-1 TaxID=1389203 RepID=A0A9Q3DRQ2_9BASI|nr:hypothetical protein [Austropuccinia psidii MF-1]
MAPKSSSASSATRKKHARKAQNANQQIDPSSIQSSNSIDSSNQEKFKKEKKDKKTPKVKKYIPPPTYSGELDPVDTFKLSSHSSLVQPERVIILRKLGKKDPITIERGLIEWSNWLKAISNTHSQSNSNLDSNIYQIFLDSNSIDEIIASLPVYLHHFPKLTSHPSRLIRSLSFNILNQLIQFNHNKNYFCRPILLNPVQLEKSDYIGSWIVGLRDPDRSTRNLASKAWNEVVDLSLEEACVEGKLKLKECHNEILQHLFSLIQLSDTKTTSSSQSSSNVPRKEAVLEESSKSTSSRLRASAFEAFTHLIQIHPQPEDLFPLILDSSLCQTTTWEILVPNKNQEPIVRKAIWGLVHVLCTVEACKPLLHSLVPIFSSSVLQAGFAERDFSVQESMIIGLVSLFKKYPSLWLETDQSVGRDLMLQKPTQELITQFEDKLFSDQFPVINLFYSYLQLGCSGNPILLYPALLPLLTSFPTSVINMTQFFTHFWTPYHNRSLRSSGAQGLIAFFSAWADCILFFDKKLSDQATSVVSAQFERMLSELTSDAFKVGKELDALITVICHVVQKSSCSLTHLWPIIEAIINNQPSAQSTARYVNLLCKARVPHEKEPIRFKFTEASSLLSNWVLTNLLEDSSIEEDVAWIPTLMAILEEEVAGRQVFDEPSRQSLLLFCKDRLPRGVWGGSESHFNLFLLLLECVSDGIANQTWLDVMNSQPFDFKLKANFFSILTKILNHIKSNPNLQLPKLEFDQFALTLLSQLLQDDPTFYTILEPIVVSPQFFVTKNTIHEMFSTTSAKVYDHMNSLLFSPSLLSHQQLHSALLTSLTQLQHYQQANIADHPASLLNLKQLATASFIMNSLLGILDEESLSNLAELASQVYKIAIQQCPPSQLPKLFLQIFQLLRDCVTDINCRIHPFDLTATVRQLLQQQNELQLCNFLCMLPIGNVSDDSLVYHSPVWSFSPLLLKLDPLIRLLSDDQPATQIDPQRSYDRLVLVILDLFAQDRKLAQSHFWLWEHCMYIGQLARFSLAQMTPSHYKENTLSHHELEAIVSVVDTHTTYLISLYAGNLTPLWHVELIKRLENPNSIAFKEADPLELIILNLIKRSLSDTTVNFATVALHRIFDSLFKYSDSTTQDFESWLAFARRIESSNISVCLAVVHSLTPYLSSYQKFQQYQNLLAGKLTDTPASAANTTGLRLVEVLCATAPPPASMHIFLPQQRILFMLQTVGGWLKSDEYLEIALNLKLLDLFLHVAPIVQSVMGSHWDLIVDLITVNLEEASWENDESMLLAWSSCHLIQTIQNILKCNHILLDKIGAQFKSCIKLALDLFISAPIRFSMNAVTHSVLQAIENVLRDTSAHSLCPNVSVPSLAKLITSPSAQTSVLAFTLAQATIKRLVGELVIEVELTPESSIAHSIPFQLLIAATDLPEGYPTHKLMLWLLIFSYFAYASSRLRSAYSLQLSDDNLVSAKLLPLLHATLQIGERGKPVDISIWDIPSFDIFLMDEIRISSIPLAAHVYYNALRIVPSHIRLWWDGCRNKQLSLNMTGFIGRYFSPILINQELEKLKKPETIRNLIDENMSIKVSSVAKEVKVTYTIDEESMEILVRIPGDYPLQPVEVLDVRKVGVPEATWRAWLLIVQQTIANHNGSIVEALGLFKKNISLHFDGVEACSICYAIISVVDRSLPNKSCRTCHNQFHPSCLYKWFSTSHGSSCPLCRSLF